MDLLDIRDVNITYKMPGKDVYAVQDVSLKVGEHESVGIVGESGSGKSTLAMGILRLLPSNAETTGQALLEGQDILAMDEVQLRQVRWVKMAVVFQKAMNALSPVHRIGTQMEDIYLAHYPEASRQEIKDRIFELLKMMNLSERVYSSYPHELSGGMMQRVAIALSLIFKPELLIMDEATTALDVVTQSQILDEIMQLEKQMHIARIMITHDVSVVASTCQSVVVMYAGQLMESGAVTDVLVHPRHPYTQGLLKSFPSFNGERGELRGIPGNLPDLSVKSGGCVFAPRCPFADQRCRTSQPKLTAAGPGWQTSCHHPLGGEPRG